MTEELFRDKFREVMLTLQEEIIKVLYEENARLKKKIRILRKKNSQKLGKTRKNSEK